MSRSNYISKTHLISSVKSGPQLVTISNVTILKDDLGEEKLYKGNKGVVITFKNDEIEHQELYWLHGHNYSKLLKLLKAVDYELDHINTKHVIGRKLWIVIKHNIRVNNGIEEGRESELIAFSTESKEPNYPPLIEEYDVAAIEDNNEFPEPNF